MKPNINGLDLCTDCDGTGIIRITPWYKFWKYFDVRSYMTCSRCCGSGYINPYYELKNRYKKNLDLGL